MASLVITSVHSALYEIELLENVSSDVSSLLLKARLRTLKNVLRKLRTFLLCVRKLGHDVHPRSNDNNGNKDGRLGSLFERIEDAVCRNAQEIHPQDGIPSGIYDKIEKFECSINSFVKEIYDWYVTLSDYSWQSSCPTTTEVMQVTDSILENIVGFTHLVVVNINYLFTAPYIIIDPVEALGKKIKFLKNFIRFATLQNVGHGQLEDLLIHIQAVAVNAAFLTSALSGMNFRSSNYKEWWETIQFKISEVLQTIKPVDPQVYQTYIQVLTSSKLSRRLHSPTLDLDDNPIIVMEDFIDSLISDLWEILKGSCPVISVKHQLQVLYEGLRFLRTILEKQPNKFDEKIRDLTGVVICDAGVIIFSHSQKDVTRDLGLPDLLERINVIQAEVGQKILDASTSRFSRTNVLGCIDFLLKNLIELTSTKANSNVQSRIQIITEELVTLRSFLEEIADIRNEHEELQALWNRVVGVAYRMEFLIDPLEVGDIPDSLSASLESIMEDIQNIKTDALKNFCGKKQDIKIKEVSRTFSHVQSQSNAPITNEVVGFDSRATSIIDRLTRGSKQLRIIPLVGMPGLGKTTLATKVYNNSSIVHHFHVRAWCYVSQVFDKKNVLLELLKHVDTKLPDRYFEMTEQDLAEQLRRCLKRRTYLIFLDDVWDIQAWNDLEGSLPDDYNGSRIILTTRLLDAVPHSLLDEDPIFLRQLTNEESWELLQKKLFPGNSCPPALHELGMQIAESCKGLPLTIVIVAGLLATMEQEGWKEILESLSSGIISSTEQCMNTLELSYKHLPNHLKPCFLYFGAFQEDQEVSVKRLTWLWIAEGFIHKSELKNLEDVATDYMMDLIGRSLVMVAKQKSVGSVKSCRIHDLLHDFCVTKAKEENFFHLLKGYDELLAFNEPCYLRRLCIYSKPKHFKESKLFCPRVRSLLFFSQRERDDPPWLDISFAIHIFKLLRVLDIEQIDLSRVFPTEIELLVHLKYLAIQGMVTAIPSSIINLSNLETFILDPRGMLVSFPDLWNLHKLRHLYIRRGYKFIGVVLPIKNLDCSSDLCELDSFSGAIIPSGLIMEKQMRKFPNIRRLKAKIVIYKDDAENFNKILVPDFLSRLESLNLSPLKELQDNIELEIGFPRNIKKLTLSLFGLPWSKISAIGKLPNLEVLKLLEKSFSGETWEMEEGEFLKLRVLKMASLDIVKWTDSDDQLPCLEKLVLEGCRRLEELPSCLEGSSTLEMIEVSSCSKCVSTLVQQIQEVQMDMGNSDMKILIRQDFSKSS